MTNLINKKNALPKLAPLPVAQMREGQETPKKSGSPVTIAV